MSRRFLIPGCLAALVTAAAATPVNFTPFTIDDAFFVTQPLEIQVADLDGDALPDLVVALNEVAGDVDSLRWYRNDGAGGFDAFHIDATLGIGVEYPAFIVCGDFALDSLADIVVATWNWMFLYENGGGGVFTRNQIDGGLSGARDGVIVDVDGDLDSDILFTTNGGIYWEENEGIAGFSRRTIHAVAMVDNGVDAGDLDGDSDTDVVASIYNAPPDHWLGWYERTGGSYAQHTFDVLQEDVTDLRIADFNGDGRPDIVACTENNHVIRYENGPGPTFSPEIIDNAFNQVPRRLAVVDIDNDTDSDVVVVGGNSAMGEVVYFENDGAGGFTRRPVDATSGNRLSLVAARVGPGSLPDLFVAQQYPHALVHYRNLGFGTGVGATPRAGLTLRAGYPNPFSAEATIECDLHSAGHVTIDVFRVDGSRVRRIASRGFPAGLVRVRWDGRDDDGAPAASGVYIVRAAVDGASRSTKLILQR